MANIDTCLKSKFALVSCSFRDRRLLSDLWFLKASPQQALNAPRRRGCIYPYSFFHLHGMFQFFAYGVIFPIGYFVGRHGGHQPVKRPLHIVLQVELLLNRFDTCSMSTFDF
jgi:hypothetical protein